MKIESPFTVFEVKFQRRYPGYIYRREIVDDSHYGGDGNLEMVNCYSDKNGVWIGDARMARFICKKMGILVVEKARRTHSVASIGWNQDKKKWYGWSHRGICGFGKGDKIFEENYGNDSTLLFRHGKVTIKTPAEAKLAAKRFAAYVS
jgi:hypothetical protein